MNPSVSDTPPPAEAGVKPAKPTLTARFKHLLVEYGPLALVVNYLILGLVVAGFYGAIRLGFQPESTGEKAGTWAAAYGFSRMTMPLRLLVVLVITPRIARIPPVARFIAKNKHRWSF
ncbi:hypothetical protein ACLESO_46840 [Pyxidicoccus sp. 3LG]